MKERKRRVPPKLTEFWLREEAVRYLQRWPASESRLRTVLWKRVDRSQECHGGSREDAAPLVDAVVAGLIQSRLLDDEALARAWQRTLRLRGTSQRMIALKLREKGVPGEVIQQLQQDEREREEGSDPERISAVAYARRRRLGPFRRQPDDSPERRRKDLASMARAGFSFGVARDVLTSDSEALASEAEGF